MGRTQRFQHGRKKKKKKFKAARASSPVVDATTTHNEKAATDFTLHIPEAVYEKVMYWIDKASPNEVSGFGHIDFDEETREFRVTDAILLEQEVAGTTTEIDEAAIARAMYQYRNVPGALKWHWHSHPTFSVFWSGTDMDLIRQLGRQGWIVATVLNCKRESRTAFLQSVDVMGKPHDVFVDDFKMTVERVYDEATKAAYDQEFDGKVKEVSRYHDRTPYVAPTPPTSGRQIRTREEWEEYDRANFGTAHIPATIPLRLTPKEIPAEEYDRMGYAFIGQQLIYNPCYDDEVNTSDARMIIALDEMSPQEIEALRPRCPKFNKIVQDFILSQASATGVY